MNNNFRNLFSDEYQGYNLDNQQKNFWKTVKIAMDTRPLILRACNMTLFP